MNKLQSYNHDISKGKKCSNDFLHTSIVVEKENHTRGDELTTKSKGVA
jgi:hypothetical protein